MLAAIRSSPAHKLAKVSENCQNYIILMIFKDIKSYRINSRTFNLHCLFLSFNCNKIVENQINIKMILISHEIQGKFSLQFELFLQYPR